MSLYLSLSPSNGIFWHITVLYQNQKNLAKCSFLKIHSWLGHWGGDNILDPIMICEPNIWGNLLRSVPHIYFGLKIKSYQYLGHYRRFRFIHGSYWQGNIRPLLFEPKFHFLPLRNFLGHTVTNRFLQIVIVVWLITTS